ncbi:MAG: DUF1320 domain-containing protein [SAR324 cluster bacterium]|nr:DUF1320 domain-containing protein [SAR324 cluster bacterium]
MYSAMGDLLHLVSEGELIQLTDDDGFGVVDPLLVDAALERADQKIDSYLGSLTDQLPLDPVPAIITQVSAKLGLFELYLRRQAELPESWVIERKSLLQYLSDLSSGKTKLLGIAESQQQAPAAAMAVKAPEDSYPNLSDFGW